MNMRRNYSLLAQIASVCFILPIAGCSGSATNSAPTTVTKFVTITASASPAPSPLAPTSTPSGPATTLSDDGTFIVGTDIAPGTYKTAGPSVGSMCAWERLRDLRNDDMSSTIASGIEYGQAFVTIEPTDVAFNTSWCMPWQKVS